MKYPKLKTRMSREELGLIVVAIVVLLVTISVIVIISINPLVSTSTTENEGDNYTNNYYDIVGIYTDMLYVHPDGDNSDGSTWEKAFTTINEAYDEASSDANDLTLIVIAIGTYDLDTSGIFIINKNIILYGVQQQQITITNDHENATGIFRITSFAKLQNLILDMGSDKTCGINFASGSSHSEVDTVNIFSTNSDDDNYLIRMIGSSSRRFYSLGLIGTNETTGMLIDGSVSNLVDGFYIWNCNMGIHINNSASDNNIIKYGVIQGCYYGVKIDAGNTQVFYDMNFFNCVDNINDAVGDSTLQLLVVDNPQSSIEPTGLTGVTVNGGVGAEIYGSDTSIYTSTTHPFIVQAVMFDFTVNERCGLRLSADGGTTHFYEIGLQITAVGAVFLLEIPSTTIFNAGTEITCSVCTESGGDSAEVAIQILQY